LGNPAKTGFTIPKERTMRHKALDSIAALILILTALVLAQPATAAPQPSSDLLLPYFEVDLNGGLTTLFAVVNSHDEAVTARISVFSNWGIEVLSEAVTLDPDEVKTINLADWIRSGNVPSKALKGQELSHLQAALTGQESQKSGMYYSSVVSPNLAVGFVEIHLTGSPRPDTLWGDYFTVDPLQDFAQGEILVNIDRTTECGALCARRALRFLTGGGFDGGTEVIIWTGRRGAPTANGYFNPSNAVETKTAVYDEKGKHIDDRLLELRPVEIITIAELGLSEPFGWLNVESDTEFFMAVRYSANNRFSVGLVSHCLPVTVIEEPPCTGPDCNPEPPCTGPDCNPEPPCTGPDCNPEPPCTGPDCNPQPENPAIDIEKATNGHDADNAPGVELDRDSAVTWTYQVTNTGDVDLSNVTVTDDDSSLTVSCPKNTLAVGATMTCTASGTAYAKNYRNLGTVVGTSPKGSQVTDEDPSNYHTPEPPVECGACDGKITTLTLQYLGDAAAHVEVIAKRGGNGDDVVHSGVVQPGGTFTVVGPASGNGGFAGTLGTEINIYTDGDWDAFLHTSCSAPVGPGTIVGSFMVVEGASKNGGALCPM
jgi:hypothetical protein